MANINALHPSIAHFLPLFDYEHLPPHLQAVSSQFAALANYMVNHLDGAECAAGLRKLLEAKDCAVRARILQNVASIPVNVKP
jgi:hypothetical protein